MIFIEKGVVNLKISLKSTTINLIFIIFFLNFFDLTFTLIGLSLGHITEANPIMDYLYQYNPWAFSIIKLLVPSIFLAIIYWIVKGGKESVVTKGLLTVTAVIYSFIAILHIQYLILSLV